MGDASSSFATWWCIAHPVARNSTIVNFPLTPGLLQHQYRKVWCLTVVCGLCRTYSQQCSATLVLYKSTRHSQTLTVTWLLYTRTPATYRKPSLPTAPHSNWSRTFPMLPATWRTAFRLGGNLHILHRIDSLTFLDDCDLQTLVSEAVMVLYFMLFTCGPVMETVHNLK